MTTVLDESWLRARLDDAPEELRARMLEAVVADTTQGERGTITPPQMAARLRAVAERLLGEAVAGPASTETAVTLLAADGLATLACELVADTEPGSLGREATPPPGAYGPTDSTPVPSDIGGRALPSAP